MKILNAVELAAKTPAEQAAYNVELQAYLQEQAALKAQQDAAKISAPQDNAVIDVSAIFGAHADKVVKSFEQFDITKCAIGRFDGTNHFSLLSWEDAGTPLGQQLISELMPMLTGREYKVAIEDVSIALSSVQRTHEVSGKTTTPISITWKAGAETFGAVTSAPNSMDWLETNPTHAFVKARKGAVDKSGRGIFVCVDGVVEDVSMLEYISFEIVRVVGENAAAKAAVAQANAAKVREMRFSKSSVLSRTNAQPVVTETP